MRRTVSALLILVGCASAPTNGPQRTTVMVTNELLAPVALYLDGKPVGRVYPGERKCVQFITSTSGGQLEARTGGGETASVVSNVTPSEPGWSWLLEPPIHLASVALVPSAPCN